MVNHYSYDPYGNATLVSETVPNPFRYIGAVWDGSTGLYKMGERYDDPSVGRFTQEDPAGDGYGYTYNNPVNFVDPSGESADKPDDPVGGPPPGSEAGGSSGEEEGRPSRNSTRGSKPNQGRPPKGLAPRKLRPPGYGPGWRIARASRPSELKCGGMSYYNPSGGEWRYYPEDRYHYAHWDYNSHDRPNSPWENVPLTPGRR